MFVQLATPRVLFSRFRRYIAVTRSPKVAVAGAARISILECQEIHIFVYFPSWEAQMTSLPPRLPTSFPFPLPVPLSPIRRLQSITLHVALIGPSSSLVPSLLHQRPKTSAIQAPVPSQVERNFLLSHYILQHLLQLAEVPSHPSSEAALNRHFRHLIFILHRRKTSLHTSQTETGSELGSTSSRTALSA